MKTAENLRVRRMVLCALFAALTAVCSQIAIPMPWGVPINLALFAVYMAGTMLGAFWGTVSQLVFVALAAIGVPVLAGFQGGPSAIFGKTGGYAHRLHSGSAHHRPALQGCWAASSGRSAWPWSWAVPSAMCWAPSGS